MSDFTLRLNGSAFQINIDTNFSQIEEMINIMDIAIDDGSSQLPQEQFPTTFDDERSIQPWTLLTIRFMTVLQLILPEVMPKMHWNDFTHVWNPL